MNFHRDLREKLTNQNYHVKDANCILNSLTKTNQVIFICNGSENTDFNRLIIEYVESKTHQVKNKRISIEIKKVYSSLDQHIS